MLGFTLVHQLSGSYVRNEVELFRFLDYCAGVRWFETDVSGLPIGSHLLGSRVLDSLTLADGTDR